MNNYGLTFISTMCNTKIYASTFVAISMLIFLFLFFNISLLSLLSKCKLSYSIGYRCLNLMWWQKLVIAYPRKSWTTVMAKKHLDKWLWAKLWIDHCPKRYHFKICSNFHIHKKRGTSKNSISLAYVTPRKKNNSLLLLLLNKCKLSCFISYGYLDLTYLATQNPWKIR